ncbi:DL-endopeptidase inhibitor IseA family protein [Brevibacillus sp. SAFN-007a]|uniref:DL-endopeptidase inhibitor IseA family protein n=1 Tax=Brevibacillus sp. SAFN-007a TaxID=3436862 RepID=UPI003F81BDD9
MKFLDEWRMFKQLISSAEQVWTQIATSPRGKVVYTVNGVDYTPLPDQYNTKRKISRIFRRYWGKQLTETMIRNLQLRTLKGKLCIPYGRVPTFPCIVQSIQVKANRPNQRVVAAILVGGEQKTRVDYRLIRAGETDAFTIMKRSGREGDVRYRPLAAAVQTLPKPAAKPVPKPMPKPILHPAAKPEARSTKKTKGKGKKKLLKTP